MTEVVKQEINSDPEESSSILNSVDLDVRITELAYLKAKSIGFEPGHELEDWLEAEQELML